MRWKNKCKSRRGSALLIVLGMLSFMVVSAVGFSVYMRQGRAPSSYLSRNVSSRYLVKAALANAIEELEGGFMSQADLGRSESTESGYFFGVYDDPYPGVGPQSSESVSKMTDRRTGRQVEFTENGNCWFLRVFCPFGLLDYPDNKKESAEEPPLTAPTLTLEALAYLPPAIIDDVRKISRQTRTAQWRPLPYESGRYAYTAVNVTDLLDVNRLRASVPRNSGRDRITLATLTSSDPTDPTSVDQGRADALDNILEKPENAKISGNVVPFTSLADFNVAAIGSSYAPLMQYIGTSAAQLPQSDERANGMFVTDTWFQSTNATGTTSFDLGGVDGPGQPFKVQNFTATSFLDVLSKKNGEKNVGTIFEKNLGIGLVCLYDYLDSDSVPVSLALPTVEAVPMVVGVSAPAGLQPVFGAIGQEVTAPEFSVPGTGTDANGNVTPLTGIPVTRTLRQQGITSFGNNVIVHCVAAYPFKRMVTSKRLNGNDFKARGILRVWLAPAGMGCRPANDAILRPQKNDIVGMGNSGLSRDGVATFVSANFNAGTAINAFQQDVTKTEEAVKSFTLTFPNLDVEMPVYWDVKETAGTVPGYTAVIPDSSQFKSSYKTLYNTGNMTTWLRPLTVEGAADNEWQSAVNGAPRALNAPYNTGLREMAALSGRYRIYAAVWVQIIDKNNKVVDMVPASLADDNDWLNASMPQNNALYTKCGDGSPILNFVTGSDITFDANIATAFQTPPTFDGWKCLYAVDPRYNWAPEDWFGKTSTTATENEWISELGLNGSSSPLLGKTGTGRDRDIFMFVSDQEYLQSIGELQFLAQVSRLNGQQSFLSGDFAPNYNRESFETRTSPTTGNFANGTRFWRTYSAYEIGDNRVEGDYIDPYNMLYNDEVVNFTSSSGTFKINPYTEDDRILAAALVGTPYDYYVASTNDNQQQTGGKKNQLLLNNELTVDTMKTKYGFGAAELAKLDGDNLLNVMDKLRETFAGSARSGTVRPWDELWNDLEWQRLDEAKINEQNDSFLGATLAASGRSYLHGVDRKYLYSFWRDCFANEQQLYLIFVRAEPASVGGGSSGGVSSAQLGGRAVALVWRDPAVPRGSVGGIRKQRSQIKSLNLQTFREFKKDQAPHRTRVLFYHQFD